LASTFLNLHQSHELRHALARLLAKNFGADDECGLCAYLPNLHRLEFQSRRFQIRRSLGQVERLDPNHLVFFVVIENHAGRDFLRLNNPGIVQRQVECFSFLASFF
jgi:hypothetical protein